MVGFQAVNKMGVPNIAMIFGPTLMSNENVSIHLFLWPQKARKCLTSNALVLHFYACNWLKNLASLSQPISSKSTINHDLFTCVLSPFAGWRPAASIRFEIWLACCIVWVIIFDHFVFVVFLFQPYFHCCHIFQTGRMDDASINQEFSIVGDMINYYQWLFSVSLQNVM